VPVDVKSFSSVSDVAAKLARVVSNVSKEAMPQFLWQDIGKARCPNASVSQSGITSLGLLEKHVTK
jgi:hypothetical protein